MGNLLFCKKTKPAAEVFEPSESAHVIQIINFYIDRAKHIEDKIIRLNNIATFCRLKVQAYEYDTYYRNTDQSS
jgi:hypothetical protein